MSKPLDSSFRWNDNREAGGFNEWQVLPDARVRRGLDSSLRRNDGFVWTPAFIRLGQANRVIRALRPHKKGVFPDCAEGCLEQAAFGQGDRFFIPDHDVIQHPDIDQPQHLF